MRNEPGEGSGGEGERGIRCSESPYVVAKPFTTSPHSSNRLNLSFDPILSNVNRKSCRLMLNSVRFLLRFKSRDRNFIKGH